MSFKNYNTNSDALDLPKMLYNSRMPNGEELSEREVEILQLVATGASNKEIAQALSISPNTVKVHLRNIFAKIEVASRTEATLYALKAGIISSPAAPAEEAAPTPPAEPVEVTPPPVEVPPAPPQPARFSRRLLAALLLLAVLLPAGWSIFRLTSGLPLIGPAPTATAIPPNIRRWSELDDMPAALSAPAAAAFERTLVIIGGKSASGTSRDCLQYNIQSNTWETRSPKPTAVDLAGAVLLGEGIYVPGGRAADGSPTRQLEVYLPRTDEWQTRAPLPQALYAYGLAAFEGRLYLFGGWDGQNYLDSVYIYDPQTDQWLEGQAMPYAAAYLAASSAAGKIFVMGGVNQDGILERNTAFYPQRNIANEAAWEPRQPLPEARQAFGAATLVDAIYLVGGLGAHDAEPDAVMYDAIEDRWVNMEPRSHPLMGSSTGAYLAVVSSQNLLHILGGEILQQASRQHAAYQAIYTVTLPVLQNNSGQ